MAFRNNFSTKGSVLRNKAEVVTRLNGFAGKRSKLGKEQIGRKSFAEEHNDNFSRDVRVKSTKVIY